MTRKVAEAAVNIAAIDRVTRPVRRMNEAISSMVRPVRRVRRSVDSLSEATGLRSLQRQTAALSRSLRGLSGGVAASMGRLSGLGAMVGLGGGGLVAGLGVLTTRTAELGDQVGKTALRLGIGAEALQELRYAAERSGVAQRTFDLATQRMVRRVAEAAQGTGEARDAIAALGLDARALGALTPDRQMAALADALQGVASQSERVRLAFKLFDSEGVSMVQMLAGGSAGLSDLRRQARDLGLVMSADLVRASEAFADSQTNLGSALQGVRNIVGAELLPVVGRTMDAMTRWVVANRALVKTGVAEWAARLRAGLARLGQAWRDLQNPQSELRASLRGVSQTLSGLWAGFRDLSDLVGGPVQGALVLVGGYVAGPMVAALATTVTATLGLVGALVRVTASMTALAAAGLRRLVPSLATTRAALLGARMQAVLMTGALKANAVAALVTSRALAGRAVAGVAAFSRAVLVRAVPALATLAGSLKAVTVAMMTNPIGLAVAGIAGGAALLIRYWTPIKSFFVGLWRGVGDGAAALWGRFKRLLSWQPLGLVVRAWQPLAGFYSGLARRLWSVVSGLGARLAQAVTPDLSGVGGAILDGLRRGVAAARAGIERVMGGLAQMVRDFLPFSPARTGPLADLDRVKIGETVAAAVNPVPLKRAMAGAMMSAVASGTAVAERATIPVPRLAAVPEMAIPVRAEARPVAVASVTPPVVPSFTQPVPRPTLADMDARGQGGAAPPPPAAASGAVQVTIRQDIRIDAGAGQGDDAALRARIREEFEAINQELASTLRARLFD